MSDSAVSIERRDRVAIVRFDRGDGVNALSHGVMTDLRAAAMELSEEPEISAIVLTGTAEVFTKGFDLKDPVAQAARAGGLSEKRRALQLGPRLCRAWSEAEPLTIAAVEGWCVGGGVALSTACDLRVAGQGATFYAPEIERGMNMGWRAVPRLTALVGPARAKRILVLAERVGAEEALAWGLADKPAPAGGALEAALEWAERAAALPPVQVRMVKQQVDMAAHPLSEAVSYMDGDQHLLARSGEDFQEGVNAFLEKRKPRYTGR